MGKQRVISMVLQLSTSEAQRNLGKILVPGTYRIIDVLCEDSGKPAQPVQGRKRAKRNAGVIGQGYTFDEKERLYHPVKMPGYAREQA